jgi:CRISPR-associated endonuclease Cas2
MARTHTQFSVELLSLVAAAGTMPVSSLFSSLGTEKSRKVIYDAVFRLVSQGLLTYTNPAKTQVAVTADGASLLTTKRPERDGVWKMVIFDIPERQRTVRTFLRNRLKTLGFKMWQASIWVSPYRLDKKLEDELAQLAEKFFIRLIKTTDINYTKDLENLFIK